MKLHPPPAHGHAARSFASRRPLLILGKMRKLAAWRRRHGIPINQPNWARIIASALAEVSAANLMHRGRQIGLDELTAGLAHEIADAERQRRERQGHHGRYGFPLPASALGELLDLVTIERDELEFWPAIAIDETPEAGRKRRVKERAATALGKDKARERKAKKQARDRKRAEQTRRANGCKIRAEYLASSIAAQKPWIAAGFKTRRTWERHGKPGPVACRRSVARVAGPSPRGLKGDFNRSKTSDTVSRRKLIPRTAPAMRVRMGVIATRAPKPGSAITIHPVGLWLGDGSLPVRASAGTALVRGLTPRTSARLRPLPW